MQKMFRCFFCILLFVLAINTASFGLDYNAPGVFAYQDSMGRWRDHVTGQFVTAPPAGWVPPTYTPPSTSTTTGARPTVTPTSAGGTTPPTASAPVGATAAVTPASTAARSTIKSNWKQMSRGGKIASVFGLVGGAFLVYDATKGKGRHTVGSIIEGVGGGATFGASFGSIVPGVGTGVGAAVGAVLGGLVSGSQLFSETDCLTDPVTGKFTCCHTAFNKGERYVDIGGYMFCNATNELGEELSDSDGRLVAIKGSVRQCQVGGSNTKGGWWHDLWKDDAWSANCVVRLCEGAQQPAPNLTDPGVNWIEDVNNICWRWQCDDGYVFTNGKCLAADGAVPVDNYDVAIQRIQALQQDLINKCGNIF